MPELLVRDYGKINAWNFYGLSESKQIQIHQSDKIRGDVDCFLHLLFSNSSTEVEYVEINTPLEWVVLRLWGPVTDDQGRLSTEFKLRRFDLHRLLPIKEERYEVVRRLHELGGPGEGFKETCKALRVRGSVNRRVTYVSKGAGKAVQSL